MAADPCKAAERPGSSAGPQPRRPRRWRAASLAVVAIAAAPIVLHAAAGRSASAGALRARIERAVSERLGGRVEGATAVDWLGRVAFGPVVVPATRAGRPPVLRIERIVVRVRLLPLLLGRAEAASIAVRGVRIEAGPRGEELVALARRVHRERDASTAPGALPELRFDDAVLSLAEGSRSSTVGPLAGRIKASRAGPAVDLAAEAWTATGGQLRGRVVWGAGSVAARVHGIGLGRGDLAPGFGEALPFAVVTGSLSFDVELAPTRDPQAGVARVAALADAVVLEGHRLATEPVGPLRMELRGAVHWDLRAGRIGLEDAELALGSHGEARIGIRAEVRDRPEPRFALAVRADDLDYATAVGALPPALAPGDGAPHIRGPIDASLSLAGPLRRPADWEIGADLDLSALAAATRRAEAIPLRGSFRYRPAGSARELVVGPENPLFVPIGALPPHAIRAVTTSEDAGFFAHRGFDFQEIRNALAERAGSGRRARGASTITQQLAKNLFLSRERTIARKVREALVTVALEAALPKERLLEIYLNVVEWGPGVYGIGEAARHYFRKDARALTPKEAAFLATIIPNPVRYHVYYARGSLTPAWEERVRDLLTRMRDRGQLSDSDLAEAVETPLVFARG